ncbi:hypothetical protein [Leucobacter celer]|uniref:hypothetical protein n=1 Tax=Leucobacter celer TaxID=668625 RepID=UPI0006A7A55E|nr:hypothetical protein [Leucobacter celer]
MAHLNGSEPHSREYLLTGPFVDRWTDDGLTRCKDPNAPNLVCIGFAPAPSPGRDARLGLPS